MLKTALLIGLLSTSSVLAAEDPDKLTELEYARADALAAKRQALQLQLQLLDAEQQKFMDAISRDHKMAEGDQVDWAKRAVVRAPKAKK